jgi:hypothetical protein
LLHSDGPLLFEGKQRFSDRRTADPESGLRIVEAILAGERNPEQLAAFCSTRIKASRQTVAKSLHGNWDEALLFCLKTALETYRFSQTKFKIATNALNVS